jgi:hypothetical protein
MATTQKIKIVDENEYNRAMNTGVSYHLRHAISGRWYAGRGRYSDGERRVTFRGRREARRAIGAYFRKTESVFLELVPFCLVPPRQGHEAEAARLLEVGPEPLVPKK